MVPRPRLAIFGLSVIVIPLKLMVFFSRFSFVLLTVPARGQVDRTLVPGAIGDDVVVAVIRKLAISGIFYPERGFLHRIARYITHDGHLLAPTDGNSSAGNGGIWRVPWPQFKDTKDVTRYEEELPPLYRDIKHYFGIDWPSVQWADLDKPLYSGLAISIYMAINPWHYDPIPITTYEQQIYLAQLYKLKSAPDYVIQVAEHEKEITCTAKRDICFILPVGDCLDKKMVEFVVSVIDALDVGANATTISYVMVDSTLQFDVHLRGESAAVAKANIRDSGFVKSHICNNSRRRSASVDHTGKAIFLTLNKLWPFLRRQDSVLPVFVVITDVFAQDDIVAPSTIAHKLGISIVPVGVSYQVDWEQLYTLSGNNSLQIVEAEDLSTLRDDAFRRVVETTCLVPAKIATDRVATISARLGPRQATYFKLQPTTAKGVTVCFNSSDRQGNNLDDGGHVMVYVSWSVSNPNSALHDEAHRTSFHVAKPPASIMAPPDASPLAPTYLAFVSLNADSTISLNITFVPGHINCSIKVLLVPPAASLFEEMSTLGRSSYNPDDETNRVAFVILLWLNIAILLLIFIIFVVIITVCLWRGKII